MMQHFRSHQKRLEASNIPVQLKTQFGYNLEMNDNNHYGAVGHENLELKWHVMNGLNSQNANFGMIDRQLSPDSEKSYDLYKRKRPEINVNTSWYANSQTTLTPSPSPALENRPMFDRQNTISSTNLAPISTLSSIPMNESEEINETQHFERPRSEPTFNLNPHYYQERPPNEFILSSENRIRSMSSPVYSVRQPDISLPHPVPVRYPSSDQQNARSHGNHTQPPPIYQRGYWPPSQEYQEYNRGDTPNHHYRGETPVPIYRPEAPSSVYGSETSQHLYQPESPSHYQYAPFTFPYRPSSTIHDGLQEEHGGEAPEVLSRSFTPQPHSLPSALVKSQIAELLAKNEPEYHDQDTQSSISQPVE
jgi:hypothetical protein